MKQADAYVVVYDISSDAERRRVDKVLKGFGFRIQKSVFECKMDDKVKTRLIRKLTSLNIKTGFIKIYKLETLIGSETVGIEPNSELDSKSAFII